MPECAVSVELDPGFVGEPCSECQVVRAFFPEKSGRSPASVMHAEAIVARKTRQRKVVIDPNGRLLYIIGILFAGVAVDLLQIQRYIFVRNFIVGYSANKSYRLQDLSMVFSIRFLLQIIKVELRMKSIGKMFFGVVCLLVCSFFMHPRVVNAQDGRGSMANRRQFQEIATKLDFGGDCFLVVNTDKLVDHVLDSAIHAQVGVPVDDPHEKEMRETINRFRSFLLRNGFSAVHGMGLSSVPVSDTMNMVKFYVSRDYIDSNLPLWRGLVGWQPRRLLSLDFIPADAAMARAGTPQFDSLWKVVRSAVDEVASPVSKANFDTGLQKINTALGMDLDDLIGSLRDEFLVTVRFSKTKQCMLPSKGGMLSIPAPEILLVVSTRNDMLKSLMETKFAQHNIVLNESTAEGVLIRGARDPMPAPIPLHPAYASTAGFLLIGTTPKIVADALLSFQHKNGLVSREQFNDAFQSLSMVNNGIIYISPEMGEILGHIRDSKIEQELAASQKHPALARILKQVLTYEGKTESAAFVIQNWKKGVMVMGNSSIGGKDVATRLLAYPLRSLPGMFCSEKKAPKPAFLLWMLKHLK